MRNSGKLRNATNTRDALVEWIGRKLRNHDPLEETTRNMRRGRPKSVLKVLGGCTQDIYYQHGGQRYLITVEEAPEGTEKLIEDGAVASRPVRA